MKNTLFVTVIILIILSLFSCDYDEIPDELPTAKIDTTRILPIYVGCPTIFYQNSLYADNYEWNFGDGHTSTEENPTHTYADPGYYMVILEIFDGIEPDYDTLEVYVRPHVTFDNKTLNVNGQDIYRAVAVTSNGDYILGGKAGQFGYAAIVSFDGNTVIFDELSSGMGGVTEFRDVAIDQNGDYLFAGYTTDSQEDTFAYLVKIDSATHSISERVYDFGYKSMINSIAVDESGNYILAGQSFPSHDQNSDMHLIKTQTNLEVIWRDNYSKTSSSYEYAYGLAIASDGSGYIMAGAIVNSTSSDAYVYKVDTDGNTDGGMGRNRNYDLGGDDEIHAIVAQPNGGYVLVGETDEGGTDDAFFIKINENGSHSSSDIKIFSEAGTQRAYDVVLIPGIGYAIAGYSGISSNFKSYLIRVDLNGGNPISSIFNSVGKNQSFGIDVTNDCNGYIMAGTTNNNFLLIRTNSEGNL